MAERHRPLKAALIELWIDPRESRLAPQASHSGTLTSFLRSIPDQRESQVRAACLSATGAGATTIVFPGWTIVGTEAPSWLLQASHGRTIVFECLHPASRGDKHRVDEEEWPSWTTFIARDGEIRVTATQLFAQAYERDEFGSNLVQDLESGTRTDKRTTLWICGEVELLSGGGGRRSGGNTPVRNDTGTDDGVLRGGGVVVNPAHTRAGPQASRDKRAWLSVGGWLLHTANIYPGGWEYLQRDEELGRDVRQKATAASTAAAVWRDGNQLDESDGLRTERLFEGDDRSNIVWVEE